MSKSNESIRNDSNIIKEALIEKDSRKNSSLRFESENSIDRTKPITLSKRLIDRNVTVSNVSVANMNASIDADRIRQQIKQMTDIETESNEKQKDSNETNFIRSKEKILDCFAKIRTFLNDFFIDNSFLGFIGLNVMTFGLIILLKRFQTRS